MMAAGSSVRGLSEVTMARSASRAAIAPMSGPLAAIPVAAAAEHDDQPAPSRRHQRPHRRDRPRQRVGRVGVVDQAEHAARRWPRARAAPARRAAARAGRRWRPLPSAACDAHPQPAPGCPGCTRRPAGERSPARRPASPPSRACRSGRSVSHHHDVAPRASPPGARATRQRRACLGARAHSPHRLVVGEGHRDALPGIDSRSNRIALASRTPPSCRDSRGGPGSGW